MSLRHDGRVPDSEGFTGGGGSGHQHGADLLPHGELTCQQAIAAVLYDPSPDFVHAIYMQVRRRWRTLYERHPRSFDNEPSPVPAAPSKRMRTLHRDVAIPAVQRFVRWAMEKQRREQEARFEAMGATVDPSAASSLIAEVESIVEADISDAESEF